MPKGVYPRPAPLDLFLPQIEFDLNGGCWLWSGCTRRDGYGVFGIAQRQVIAHRAAWQLMVGPIPDGLIACHTCDVRACVNPSHIYLGTCIDNNRDAFRRGRREIRRGEQCHAAKLTDKIVRDLRSERRTLPEIDRLAAQYGVASRYLRAVARGHAWRHVAAIALICTISEVVQGVLL